MEYLWGALALGIAATYIVPLVAGLVKGFLPTSISGNFTLPTTYPSTLTAGLWSVVFSGALLALAVWALAHIEVFGRGLEKVS